MSPGRKKFLKGGAFMVRELDWTAPDRVAVSGEFARLTVRDAETPALLVDGAEGSQRLQAVPDSVSGPPEEGKPWRAEFSWDVAPFAFDAAALEFEDGTLVELSSPEEAPHLNGSTTDDLHLRTELVVAQTATREAQAEAERLRTELARAVDDLESERARHAEDARRFREGLAGLERTASDAMAAGEDELRRLAAELDAAESARAEVETLRERVAELERRDTEAEHVRATAEAAEAEAQRARTDCDRLSRQLARIREALDDTT
jgi:hypothetical protein